MQNRDYVVLLCENKAKEPARMFFFDFVESSKNNPVQDAKKESFAGRERKNGIAGKTRSITTKFYNQDGS